MAESRAAQREEIGELCDDLVEQLEEGDQNAATATVETILQRVRQYFGAPTQR
jgi:hypothetical protein